MMTHRWQGGWRRRGGRRKIGSWPGLATTGVQLSCCHQSSIPPQPPNHCTLRQPSTKLSSAIFLKTKQRRRRRSNTARPRLQSYPLFLSSCFFAPASNQNQGFAYLLIWETLFWPPLSQTLKLVVGSALWWKLNDNKRLFLFHFYETWDDTAGKVMQYKRQVLWSFVLRLWSRKYQVEPVLFTVILQSWTWNRNVRCLDKGVTKISRWKLALSLFHNTLVSNIDEFEELDSSPLFGSNKLFWC